jgi:L,D-peptidoglycan transpeptidase YkuD (ErfK/YbiS/YcfS/YnhG family)
MKKLLLLLFAFNLFAQITLPQSTKQLLLVIADDFDSDHALLQAYERSDKRWQKVFAPIRVNLGRNGLGWGEGLMAFAHRDDEPVKHEGDGKSPAGLFSLDLFFGYEEEVFAFAYKRVDGSTLCIDESGSAQYNQIITLEKDENASQRFKSFEYMKREDDLYRLGIVVGHNKKALKERGSCIFIHIEKAKGSATSGCTSLDEAQLMRLMRWLDRKKEPLLLQLPARYLHEGFK